MQKEIIEVEGLVKPIFKMLKRMAETFPMGDLGEKNQRRRSEKSFHITNSTIVV